MKIKVERIIEVPEGKYCRDKNGATACEHMRTEYKNNFYCDVYEEWLLLEYLGIVKSPKCISAKVVK